MTHKIRLGFIGGGARSMIGKAHQRAVQMSGQFVLTGGVFSADYSESLRFAKAEGLDPDCIYPDVAQFISGELAKPESQRIEAVSILTPNAFHFDAVSKLLEAGFHVVCEKPITTTLEEAKSLAQLMTNRDQAFAVAHTYTGYPMVRQLRRMIEAGVIGQIQKIDAQYYQGWINEVLHDEEARQSTWRLQPAVAGASCCFGDIGVHAFNLVEYTSGLRIKQVLADTDNFHPDNELDVDGTALFKTECGVRGLIRASQIASGEENNLAIAVYGRHGALKWSHENPNELIFLPYNGPRQILTPGHRYLADLAAASSTLPPGHPEGLFDALGNIYFAVAQKISGGEYDQAAFPNIEDGVRGMAFIDAVMRSNDQMQQWVELH
ncbi:MAG: Gfo/Idh/MocA family oxidoreductase [Luminiphilus sp.]|nr:Gfo/Idh/MocA family oxidoreductase [Luminiphilus sp.]